MSADADPSAAADARARELLKSGWAGRALTSEPPKALLSVVARLLADHPDAAEAVMTAPPPSADLDDGTQPEAMAQEARLAGPSHTDGSERLRAWAVSAALVHHAAVEVPVATERLHDDLQEYMAVAHRMGPL